MHVKIKVYNQSVSLRLYNSRLAQYLQNFLDKYYTVIQKGFGGANAETVPKVFVSKIPYLEEVILHRNQFTHFLHHLQTLGEPLTNYEMEDCKTYDIVKEDYKNREQWKLRDEQIPVNEFLKDNPVKSKLVPLATGSGKTILALYTIGELKSRLGIIVLSQFVEKWISDITQIHETTSKDIMLIQGAKSIAGIVNMAREGTLSSKYFVFSARTMHDFISLYESDPTLCLEMYGIAPLDLFPLLGIGILLIDETHMAFHSIYKTIIHTNVEYQIGLSGTLISEDAVVSRAHRVVYPKSVTYHDTLQKQYMDIYAIAYGINPHLLQTKRIKTVNYGTTAYNHIAFEKSIMKDKRLFESYFNVVKGVIEDYYIPDYDKRDSLVIFVASIAMAILFVDRLKKLYPNKTVVRYCENDPYDEMIDAEIVVSTPQSLSTGIDKPNLRVVIQTVSISSEVTNLQSAGRLRDLKDRDTKFCYIYSDNIPKQKEYHRKREQMFTPRSKTFSLRRSRYAIS